MNVKDKRKEARRSSVSEAMKWGSRDDKREEREEISVRRAICGEWKKPRRTVAMFSKVMCLGI